MRSNARVKHRSLSRADRARETRAAILDTAVRLFLRSGIAATSLDAVARELGLTKGAVYASFPSKAALVEAVAAAHSTPTAIFDPLLEPGVPLRARVRAFGRRLASTKASRQVVLLDLEYVTYAARNNRWDVATRQGFDAALEVLAVRLREVNEATGDQLPMPELQFLKLLNILGKGLLQERALHPNALSSAEVTRMVEAVAPMA